MRTSFGIPFVIAILASCSSPSATTSAHAGAPPPESAAEPAPSRAVERAPVVVELFSSEGCSSCPPADVVLRNLDKEQRDPAAEVIALELHVDYWNYLGWADPFSGASFSARQHAYADATGRRGVYTPQLIVDGERELIGSDATAASRAIAAAAKTPKAKVTIARKEARLAVAVGALPADARESSSVWLAITEAGLSTAVPRGENAGATLAHGPVVRRLTRIGGAPAGVLGPAFHGEAELAIEPAWRPENLRAVVFVEQDRSRKIIGAGALKI
jgi:hypothetical protein